MAENAIESLDQRIAELQARKARLVAMAREKERKRDVQRRIILGSGLLAMAEKGDAEAVRIIGQIVARLSREADRGAFKGWEAPVADAAAPAGDDQDQGDGS